MGFVNKILLLINSELLSKIAILAKKVLSRFLLCNKIAQFTTCFGLAMEKASSF